jgi:hypothetical protein
MKKKDLISLAKKIASEELKIRKSTDKKEINDAQNKIIKLSSQITNPEDLFLLDELIQELIASKS